jgi:hypothetical protein
MIVWFSTRRTNWPYKKMAGDMKIFFSRMANGMRAWAEACRQIGH